MKASTIKTGDRVRIKAFFGAKGKAGTMLGTVLRVTANQIRGGTCGDFKVKVRWDSGSVATAEDRVLEVVEAGQ